MKFRSEFIGAIRRGEKTQTRRPYKGHRCAFAPGHFYVIERVESVREEYEDDEGATKVRYEDKTTSLGEHIEVRAVRKEILDDISAEDAEAEGFPDPESFLDYYRAEYGNKRKGTLVWVVEFTYAQDVPEFLAVQQGLLHPPQYVGSVTRAIDEGERVDDMTLREFANDNWERYSELKPNQSADDEARRLGNKLKELRKRAQRTGVDVALEVAVITHQIQEIERKLDEAA